MSIQAIVMCLVGAAAIWLFVELAMTARRARGTMDSVDKIVEELNNTVEEARPVVAKLDGMVDEISPAVSQVEPLLKGANVAIDALNANMLEINSVLRDVSVVSNTAADVANTANQISETATSAVSRMLNHGVNKTASRLAELSDSSAEVDKQPREDAPSAEKDAKQSDLEGFIAEKKAAAREAASKQYFTYDNDNAQDSPAK